MTSGIYNNKMSTNRLWGILVLYLVGLEQLAAISRQSDIKLENNGYSDILLAFDETIPHSQSFINKTKDYFTRASKVLYIATRQRAYFKDIKILVPHTWPDDPSYQSAATDQTVYKSDIIITSSSINKRSVPQTRTYGGCGNSGIHIQFTTDFLFKDRYPPYYSHSDKFIVHQWATFRWGVFQEYPSGGEQTFYFSTAFARVGAVQCSLLLKGRTYARDANNQLIQCQTDPSTGLYTSDCKYYVYPHYPTGLQTHVSMMDHQHVQEITGFCDDDDDYATKHNAEPLNRQNRLCSHRSTWDVISNTPDFAGGRNPPTNYTDAQLVPTFTFIKAARKRRSVILMDMGHSSQDDVSLLKLSQAVAHYVGANEGRREHQIFFPGLLEKILGPKRVVRSAQGTGDVLGVNLKHDLSNMKQDDIKKLFSSEVTPSQKQVIVFSTNQTNLPNIKEFKSAGVTLHWISLHPHPGTHTGAGTPIYYSHEHPESMAHIDAVYDVIQRTEGTNAYTVKLFSVTKIIEPGHEYRDTFTIDNSLHGDLSLTVTYTGKLPLLEVTSPSRKLYNDISPETEINHLLNMIKISLECDGAEVGKWKFRLKGINSTSTISLVVLSNSTPRDGIMPIILKARLMVNNDSVPPKIAAYADVTQGQHPVTGLKVIATVFRPSVQDGEHMSPYKMMLFDKGSGADIIKDDGIYSRYFPHLTGHGDYLLTVDILDSHGSIVNHLTDVIEDPDRQNTLSISRSAHGGSVYLHTDHTKDSTWLTTDFPGGNDVYPPSRIIDLHVVRKSDMKMTVTLSWTAPGDDLDHGTVAMYDIKYGQNGLDLLKLKDASPSVPEVAIVTGSIRNPLLAGNTEYLTINVTDLFLIKRQGFAFFIRGIDDFGNKGDFSNMVTVGFSSIPEPQTARHVTGSNIAVDVSDTVEYMAVPKVDALQSNVRLWPLLFLNIILLACFLLIGVGFISLYHRDRFVQPEVLLS